MTETRGLQIGLVAALAIGIVGLVSGVRGTGREVRSYVPSRPPPVAAAEARSYADMRATMHGPNAALQPLWWQGLARPDLFTPIQPTPAERAAVLARRAERRAYDGAPPAIPHAIDQLGVPTCGTCHDAGAVIAGLVAPRMSHPAMGSCVQCHVAALEPRPIDGAPAPIANAFVGTRPTGGGERAWLGAPPTIPHSTWMRERCESCHGVFGGLGLRTTHPWRASCTQCHVPSATLDQRGPVALGGGP